jgi:hypothetical protein
MCFPEQEQVLWAALKSGCGNPDLHPVGQFKLPRLATDVWSEGSLVELCPQPVGSGIDSDT